MDVSAAINITLRVAPALERFLPPVQNVLTLNDLLNQLQDAESEAQSAYTKLLAARSGLYDHPRDYEIYRKLQSELLTAQAVVIAGVCSLAGPLSSQVAAMMPRPTPLPSLAYSGQSRHQSRAAGVSSLAMQGRSSLVDGSAGAAAGMLERGLNGGLSGLGFLPVVAGILAVLAALGLAYLLADEIAAMVHDLSAVLIARARAKQQTDLIEERRIAFDACRGRGGAGDDCLTEAERLVPTPAEAGTEIPALGGGGGGGLSTLLWVGVGGVVLVALGYGAVQVLGARSRGYRGVGGYAGVEARAGRTLPRRAGDLNGAKSRYYLEV